MVNLGTYELEVQYVGGHGRGNDGQNRHVAADRFDRLKGGDVIEALLREVRADTGHWQALITSVFERPARGIPLLSGFKVRPNGHGIEFRFKPADDDFGCLVVLIPPPGYLVAGNRLDELRRQLEQAAVKVMGLTSETPPPAAVTDAAVAQAVAACRTLAAVRYAELPAFVRDVCNAVGDEEPADYWERVLAMAADRGEIYRQGNRYMPTDLTPGLNGRLPPSPPAPPKPLPAQPALDFDRAISLLKSARQANQMVADAEQKVKDARKQLAEAEAARDKAAAEYRATMATLDPDFLMQLGATAEQAKQT